MLDGLELGRPCGGLGNKRPGVETTYFGWWVNSRAGLQTLVEHNAEALICHYVQPQHCKLGCRTWQVKRGQTHDTTQLTAEEGQRRLVSTTPSPKSKSWCALSEGLNELALVRTPFSRLEAALIT